MLSLHFSKNRYYKMSSPIIIAIVKALIIICQSVKYVYISTKLMFESLLCSKLLIINII